MTKEEFAHLFNLSIRGAIASMYLRRRVSPPQKVGEMLDGATEFTERDMAEISHALGFELHFIFEEQRHD